MEILATLFALANHVPSSSETRYLFLDAQAVMHNAYWAFKPQGGKGTVSLHQ